MKFHLSRTRIFFTLIAGLGLMAIINGSIGLGVSAQTTPKDPRLNVEDTTSPAYCGQCHKRIYGEWKGSMMGRDLDNPIVYQFYTATNPHGKFDGLGFKGFMKMAGKGNAAGDCADCHVPVQVINAHKKGKEVDLGVAMNMATRTDHGISCYFCHTVKKVNLKKDAKGRYHTRIFDTITRETREGVYHGPFKTNEAGHETVQNEAVFKSSELCGACHLNQEKHLSISTYDDWKKAYDSGKTNQTCQGCHMPLIEGAVSVAEGGPKRTGMRAHTFIGSRDAGMRKKALSLDVKTKVENDRLIVMTTVENVGAGHTVPGSSPIRNVILKVDVTDAAGKPLAYIGDKRGRLPPLAGFGNPKTKKRDPGDWAGMPGKMYAKVYMSKVVPKLGRPMVGVGGFAADKVLFNTLLQPKVPDHAKFVYKLPAGAKQAKVKARLVYRWAFKPIADRKGWKMKDLPMRSMETTVKIN